MYPFERFTERAKHVLTFAQEEAQRSGRTYIGTEHLLLGLMREEDGLAAKVLAELGVDFQQARTGIEDILRRNPPTTVPPQIVPTSRVKKVIEISFEEARRMGHNYVGTEHLLLALLIEGEGVGAHVLKDLGAPLQQVRDRIAAALRLEGTEPMTPLSPEIGRVLEAAAALAAQEHAPAVTLDHLRRALSEQSP